MPTSSVTQNVKPSEVQPNGKQITENPKIQELRQRIEEKARILIHLTEQVADIAAQLVPLQANYAAIEAQRAAAQVTLASLQEMLREFSIQSAVPTKESGA